MNQSIKKVGMALVVGLGILNYFATFLFLILVEEMGKGEQLTFLVTAGISLWSGYTLLKQEDIQRFKTGEKSIPFAGVILSLYLIPLLLILT